MFEFSYNFVNTKPCTKEAFDALLKNKVVEANCAKIKQLVEQTPADASKEELEAIDKAVKQLKEGNREKGIKNIPVVYFQASFRNSYRKNENAVPSGLCSIDLDEVNDPAEFFEALREKAVSLGLALAFITPSTKGLKLVMPVPEGAMDIEEAIDNLVTQMGVQAYFDKSTCDMARAAFMVPESYVLYRDDDILFGEHKVAEDFGRQGLTKEEVADLMAIVEYESEERGAEFFVDGISMDKMIAHLSTKYCGAPEPDNHHRNTTLYQTAKVMRVACDDDMSILHKVMPRWGQSLSEWNSTLRSACKRPITQLKRDEFENMLSQLKREKAIEEGLGIVALPAPPKVLPPVFREYARITPEEVRPAQLLALLPILGFYGTMAKANYSDPDEREDWRTPSFITVISAPPASGKGFITETYRELTEDLRLQEQPLLEQLNRYNVTKKEADKPSQPIRLMPEKLSMTSLSVQLEMARGRHLLQFTPEIDTLRSSNGSGAWNDLSTVFRKAIDNDSIGQIYMSGESHCCTVPVYLNQLIEAQPETLRRFFNRDNVLNGLVSRVMFSELPDNTGCRKRKIKKMSEFEMGVVKRTIEYLKSIGHVVTPAEIDEEGNIVHEAVVERQVLKLPRTRKMLKKWGMKHQNHFLNTVDNPAEDHFFRRAALMGFHAAMVAYMCSGCKETKEVIDFALWVAEYMLQSQLLQFGPVYNELHKKREERRLDDIIKMSQVSKFDLLGALPDEFTTADINRVCAEQHIGNSNPHRKLQLWRKSQRIVEIPTDGQTKLWRKVPEWEE